MNAKHWTLLAAILFLGGLSLYLNRDWFRTEDIQIYHRSSPRPMPARRGVPEPKSMPVSFGFDRSLELKELRVVLLDDALTNKFPKPIWHLHSDSNSLPVKTFVYGAPIRGMRPAVKGARPEMLEPGTKYRLLVQSGEFQGQHDFVPLPKVR